MMLIYGNVECEEIKTNNWKRMHGIPLKAKGRTLVGGEITCLSINKYVSRRSKKKQKKAHFRSCFNLFQEIELYDNPNLRRYYKRYGYMKKRYKKYCRRCSKE